ncbi:MAG: hypothetical protein CM1200mP6_06370 [Anaerolineaceae bacterium]|nr:MAG: hypothetical protein CM1200mP6_06370 [Anaerolineaceae bacterium]
MLKYGQDDPHWTVYAIDIWSVFRGERHNFKLNLESWNQVQFLRTNLLHLGAFPVNHRGGHCFGFVFKEPARRPFLKEKASN